MQFTDFNAVGLLRFAQHFLHQTLKQRRPKKPHRAKREAAFHPPLALQTAPYPAGVNRRTSLGGAFAPRRVLCGFRAHFGFISRPAGCSPQPAPAAARPLSVDTGAAQPFLAKSSILRLFLPRLFVLNAALVLARCAHLF